MIGFTKYKSWKVCSLENKWIKLFVAPQLGGRFIQLVMDDHEFFFVNPQLAGQEPDSTRLGENGSWLNFGGEKIWPAPQGWNSPDQWPGPPDPVLDSGEYSLSEVFGVDGARGLRLISPIDEFTGLQIVKNVFLADNSSELIVRATFCNHSNVTREWSVWSVCQLNTSGIDPANQYRIICPVNPQSKFRNGYKVMHGLVNNPQYQTDDCGNVIVNYQYLVGKVGLDTNSNWVAYMDTESGKTFVLMFQYEENKLYPEDTSVQVWTAGRGMVYSRNVIVEHPNDRVVNPPYVEMEILSPLQKIRPDESLQFEYRMLTCTIPKNTQVQGVNHLGVIASRLQFLSEGAEITIVGKYGFFKDGIIKLRIKDITENKQEFFSDLYSEKVNPFNGNVFEFKIGRENGLFDRKAHLTVDFFDCDGLFIGNIDNLLI